MPNASVTGTLQMMSYKVNNYHMSHVKDISVNTHSFSFSLPSPLADTLDILGISGVEFSSMFFLVCFFLCCAPILFVLSCFLKN